MAAVVMMRRRRRMVLLHYNGAAVVVVRSAFVHHRLGFMMGAISMNSGTMVDGTSLMA